jgi:hypothetical protein
MNFGAHSRCAGHNIDDECVLLKLYGRRRAPSFRTHLVLGQVRQQGLVGLPAVGKLDRDVQVKGRGAPAAQ